MSNKHCYYIQYVILIIMLLVMAGILILKDNKPLQNLTDPIVEETIIEKVVE